MFIEGLGGEQDGVIPDALFKIYATLSPEEKRGPGRPKIYSDDSVDKIRCTQGLGDRLRLDEALRTNMLLRVLQLILLDDGELKMRSKVEDAISAALKRKKENEEKAAEESNEPGPSTIAEDPAETSLGKR